MSIERAGPDSATYSRYSTMDSADELAIDLGGDVSARVAAMMLINAKHSREAADAARSAQESQIVAAEQRQIEEMHEQADAVRNAGQARAAAQLAGAGFQMLSIGGGDDVRLGSTAMEKLATGVGGMYAAGYDFEASRHEAEATRAGQIAERGTRNLAQIQSSIDDARDLQRKALGFLDNVRQGEAAADQATIYRRG